MRVRIGIFTWLLFFSYSYTETLYFPQYGDGGGLSTTFTVMNFSTATASGSLTFYDSAGDLQPLPLSTGMDSEVVLSLSPHSSQVIQTTGISSPVKNGYAVLELSQDEVSGVAIFQLPSGLEASVLPTHLSTGFAVYVERDASMDTGIAYCRETPDPISLRLYNSRGQLAGSRVLSFSGKHDAQFLSEIFTLGSSFQGTLIAESLSEFAMVGLRYGGGVLSTIPVTDLVEPIPPAPPSYAKPAVGGMRSNQGFAFSS